MRCLRLPQKKKKTSQSLNVWDRNAITPICFHYKSFSLPLFGHHKASSGAFCVKASCSESPKKRIVYYETLMLSITSMAVTIATPRTTKKTYTGNKNQEIRAQENETSDKDRTSLHINTSSASFFFSSIFLLHSVAVEKEKKKKTQNHGA